MHGSCDHRLPCICELLELYLEGQPDPLILQQVYSHGIPTSAFLEVVTDGSPSQAGRSGVCCLLIRNSEGRCSGADALMLLY